jgi:hypothetical protein
VRLARQVGRHQGQVEIVRPLPQVGRQQRPRLALLAGAGHAPDQQRGAGRIGGGDAAVAQGACLPRRRSRRQQRFEARDGKGPGEEGRDCRRQRGGAPRAGGIRARAQGGQRRIRRRQRRRPVARRGLAQQVQRGVPEGRRRIAARHPRPAPLRLELQQHLGRPAQGAGQVRHRGIDAEHPVEPLDQRRRIVVIAQQGRPVAQRQAAADQVVGVRADLQRMELDLRVGGDQARDGLEGQRTQGVGDMGAGAGPDQADARRPARRRGQARRPAFARGARRRQVGRRHVIVGAGLEPEAGRQIAQRHRQFAGQPGLLAALQRLDRDIAETGREQRRESVMAGQRQRHAQRAQGREEAGELDLVAGALLAPHPQPRAGRQRLAVPARQRGEMAAHRQPRGAEKARLVKAPAGFPVAPAERGQRLVPGQLRLAQDELALPGRRRRRRPAGLVMGEADIAADRGVVRVELQRACQRLHGAGIVAADDVQLAEVVPRRGQARVVAQRIAVGLLRIGRIAEVAEGEAQRVVGLGLGRRPLQRGEIGVARRLPFLHAGQRQAEVVPGRRVLRMFGEVAAKVGDGGTVVLAPQGGKAAVGNAGFRHEGIPGQNSTPHGVFHNDLLAFRCTATSLRKRERTRSRWSLRRGMILEPFAQSGIDAGLPAVAAFAEALHDLPRQANGDAFFCRGLLWSAHAQLLPERRRQGLCGRLEFLQIFSAKFADFAVRANQGFAACHVELPLLCWPCES